MPPKSVPASVSSNAFSCPHCGAFADQVWFDAYGSKCKEDTPYVVDAELIERAEAHVPDEEEERQRHEKFVEHLRVDATGRVTLRYVRNKSVEYELANLFISRCRSCGDPSLWRHSVLLHPHVRYEVEPSPDLPDDARQDFEEARTILDLSPRGAAALLRLSIQKLCKHLGEAGKDINKDIGRLVAKGLDARVQKMLDTVRVIGNESVHPGQIDMKDNRQIAAALFDLVNRIAYDLITHPREVDALYASLPPSKLDGIAKRDGGES